MNQYLKFKSNFMSERILKVRHIGIVTEDIQKSVNFWVEVMGFKIFKSMKEVGDHIDNISFQKNSSVETVKLLGPNNFMLELLHFQNNLENKKVRKPTSYGITHIAIQVKNIENKYNELRELGYEFTSSPTLTPDGYAKMNYFKAHDEVYIELVEIV
tara:strand:- start:654 stop:1124 length:471 start_codon:yes stop_codon:yes gene_type:complete